MVVAVAVLIVRLVVQVPAGAMTSSTALVIFVVCWLSWFSHWSYEQQCARDEQRWLNGPRPEVVVRMYRRDDIFSRDASMLRALGYRIVLQPRVSGADRVTFELEDGE